MKKILVGILALVVVATSLFAFVPRPQSADFIGKVISTERFNGHAAYSERTNLWKAVVKVEKINKLELITNLTPEVVVSYGDADLLASNRVYHFNCFADFSPETNRMAFTVFGGRVDPVDK